MLGISGPYLLSAQLWCQNLATHGKVFLNILSIH